LPVARGLPFLIEPVPPTKNLSVLESTGAMHLAAIQKVLPFSRILSVVEFPLAGNKNILEEQLKKAILRVAVCIDSRDVFHWVVLLFENRIYGLNPSVEEVEATPFGKKRPFEHPQTMRRPHGGTSRTTLS